MCGRGEEIKLEGLFAIVVVTWTSKQKGINLDKFKLVFYSELTKIEWDSISP